MKLHDRLYSDRFRESLRLDIDFIPHVGIANSRDPLRVKKWVDAWNREDFCIAGTLNSLMVVDYKDGTLKDLQQIPL